MIRSFLFLLFLPAVVYPQGGFGSLSKPEKWWAITHPFVAKKAQKVTLDVIRICDSLKKDTVWSDGDLNGGRLDAFRHAYWMARLCLVMKPRKAYKLGTAHEKGNRIQFEKGELEDNALPDSMSSVMDVVNNQIGIELGIQFRGESVESAKEMITSLTKLIQSGKLYILLKDKEGKFYACDGKLIIPEEWKGKWGIPKCLVKSNIHYE